jgi:type II secretory pathway pseudopilin PulG
MNPPSQSRPPCCHWRNSAGFTIVEMLMSLSMAGFVLAGILAAYIFSAKAYQAISNYYEIHQAGRNAIDLFAKDMRSASAVNACSASSLTVTVPTTFSGQGTATASKTVSWTYLNGALYRYESDTGGIRMLASNIYSCTFILFDKALRSNVVPSVAKSAQVDVKLRKNVVGQSQSEDYLSARYDLRNKP